MVEAAAGPRMFEERMGKAKITIGKREACLQITALLRAERRAFMQYQHRT